MSEGEVRLTLAQARVLVHPRRLPILRALDANRATLSEVSRAMGLHKSVVLDHLRALERAGFIARDPRERLWIKYEATPLGRRVARATPLRLVILASLALALLLAGLAWRRGAAADDGELPWEVEPVGVPPPDEPLTPLLVAALAATLLVAAWAWRRLRRAPAA